MKPRRLVRRALLYAAVLLIVVWTVAPFLWLIISSLSYKIDLLTVPLRWIPPRLTLDNYRTLFFVQGEASVNARLFLTSLRNSAMIAFLTMFVCMGLGVPAAYALARLKFRGSGLYVSATMMTQLVPPIVLVIPLYVVLRNLLLLDT